jgi:hypothetical protein
MASLRPARSSRQRSRTLPGELPLPEGHRQAQGRTPQSFRTNRQTSRQASRHDHLEEIYNDAPTCPFKLWKYLETRFTGPGGFSAERLKQIRWEIMHLYGSKKLACVLGDNWSQVQILPSRPNHTEAFSIFVEGFFYWEMAPGYKFGVHWIKGLTVHSKGNKITDLTPLTIPKTLHHFLSINTNVNCIHGPLSAVCIIPWANPSYQASRPHGKNMTPIPDHHTE